MKRYSIITDKNPREILLLRGSGCKWRRCSFCDYHLDFSKDEAANFALNSRELEKVAGTYGVLEIINSGSFCDLDKHTIAEVLRVCQCKNITRLHIECHWQDRKTLQEVGRQFASQGVEVRVKMGVETFDRDFREETLCKGMEHASPQEIADYAHEVCLLFGLTGQTENSMKQDVEIGLEHFKRVCINLMIENSTKIKPDPAVIQCFMEKLYPIYKDSPNVDILIENTDFGVGGEENE